MLCFNLNKPPALTEQPQRTQVKRSVLAASAVQILQYPKNIRSKIRCNVFCVCEGSIRFRSISQREGRRGLLLRKGPHHRVQALPGAGGALIQSTWGIWTILLSVGALSLHLEKTKAFRSFNAPLLATILGLLLSNLGIVPHHATQVQEVVNSYLLPLSVPMLLFGANLSAIMKTGKLLVTFLCASVATVAGSFLACSVVPIHSLGMDAHKIAAALTARHIGGSINFVAVTELLGVSADAKMAGLAADDVIVTLYFIVLYSLAKRGDDGALSSDGNIILQPYDDENADNEGTRGGHSISVLDGATALATAAALCATGDSIASYLGYKGGQIAIVTFLTVIAATVMPRNIFNSRLISSGEGLGSIILQVFFATVGVSGSLYLVAQTAPRLFAWSFIGVSVHLILVLIFERMFRFSRRETAVSSNANIGGPATAGSMAAAFGWRSLVIPGILIGILGYTIGTPIGIASAPVLKSLIEWRALV